MYKPLVYLTYNMHTYKTQQVYKSAHITQCEMISRENSTREAQNCTQTIQALVSMLGKLFALLTGRTNVISAPL